MIAYHINGTTADRAEHNISQDRADYLAEQGWFVSAEPIVWAENEYIDGVVVPIPLPPEPQPVVPTAEELAAQTRAQLEFAVDNFMDSKARAKGFRDRHSFALRAGITGSSWHAQAQVFGAWMDTVNDYCWQVLKDCSEGKRTAPTVGELLAELPVLEGE